MNAISLENFKNAFEVIADLVVSLDENNLAILKPRNEISEYLKGQNLNCQRNIIEELLNLNDTKAISDYFLEKDRNENEQKISFEGFLKNKLSSSKRRLKYDQTMEDIRTIERIKVHLALLNTKSAKINHLLEKKKLLEGDFPKAWGKILKKDPVYLFLKRELKYWEKFIEKSNDFKERPTGFKSQFTNDQIEYLFNEMQNSSYFDARLDYFKKIFIEEILPQVSDIIWIDKGKTRHEPNKQTIFEFFFLLKEYGYLDISNFDTKPTNTNNFYRKLEAIFPVIKNFPQGNINNKSQKNTDRQKQLEIIISGIKS